MLSRFRLAVRCWQCHCTKYKPLLNQRSSGSTGLTGIFSGTEERCNEYLFAQGLLFQRVP
jgi:hypothetical protein